MSRRSTCDEFMIIENAVIIVHISSEFCHKVFALRVFQRHETYVTIVCSSIHVLKKFRQVFEKLETNGILKPWKIILNKFEENNFSQYCWHILGEFLEYFRFC